MINAQGLGRTGKYACLSCTRQMQTSDEVEPYPAAKCELMDRADSQGTWWRGSAGTHQSKYLGLPGKALSLIEQSRQAGGKTMTAKMIREFMKASITWSQAPNVTAAIKAFTWSLSRQPRVSAFQQERGSDSNAMTRCYNLPSIAAQEQTLRA